MEALAALTDAEELVKARRAELGKAVADAIRNGVKPATLVRRTEKSAETIRTMARENGIQSLRDPNTRSFRKADGAERAEATD